MKSSVLVAAETLDDARLVELGLAGNREAFEQLVLRYQNPLCSLAYAGCGDISQSEDLAQESFIIAWCKLRDLKEPAKFKSWLFGIARNLINNRARRQSRNPIAGAEPWDETLPAPGAVVTPADHIISKEEENILWRSLEQVPDNYREPLVLFYREHQSIGQVASILDLSEETVRQRLSRGRKLLHEEVAAMIEGALARSAPGPAFTASVMMALPAVIVASSSSAIGGVAVKGSAAKVMLSALLLPVWCVFGAIASTWAMAIEFPRSSRERKFSCKAWAVFWVFSIFYFVAVNLITDNADWKHHQKLLTIGSIVSVFLYGALIWVFWIWAGKVQFRIRKEEGRADCVPGPFRPYEYRSRQTFLGLPLVHIKFNAEWKGPAAKGWIAIGTKAYGVLFAAGARAVGLISWGAIAVGVIGLGGFGVGGFAFGGVALGIAATGGGSIGYIAYGGGALAWRGASGGCVIAHDYALGGSAIARHANDTAAQAFMQHNLFFRHVLPFTGIMICLSWLFPIITGIVSVYSRQKARRNS